MKFILILLMTVGAQHGINRWDMPVMTTAEFEDRAACEAAITAAKAMEKNRRLEETRVDGICVPKGMPAVSPK